MRSDILFAVRALDGRSGHEVGWELLAELYLKKTGDPLPPIRVTDRGKPYFENSSLHFSISHTKAHAFCALSERPIGIDAEEIDRKINLRLADKILSPVEKLRFDAAPDKHTALLRLWVLKEAAVKLSGEGLRGYPNHTDFSPDDPRIREVEGCVVAILTE
ncbi:MAG: 4'-phosphopantetheinyl transferase superfamily protein [Oscillospiraceae bacterium]|nr:4'-phosphopantetheinyl transferase superfamily protein [Oscillospiraceae bacterium]